ncbi:Uncharacterized protein Rs2_33554 [Raphanus sativus]|nr:Uncharacterized protein Rs2_33554 [Raphanus sativus]
MDFPIETGIEEISDDSNSFEEISADHSGSSSPVTPKTERIHVPLTFGTGSSDHNHYSDSSFSELDSETEAFYSSLNHHLVSPGGTMDGHEFSDNQFRYGELMMKYVQCVEELRTTTLQLQDSEQEVERLQFEAEKKRDSDVLLRAELETARREIETKDADIETQKRRALELQMQVVDLESQLSDSNLKFENLVNELEVSKGCLAASDAEITKLGVMLEKKAFLETQVKETESRREVLEDQIKRSGSENMEMKSREVKLEAEISSLKTDLASRDEHIEALNKDFDNHKLRYDMLMAEKDGVSAEVDNLKAEMRSRDIQIKQMEEELNQLVFRETELVSESGNAKSIVEELRERVKELEKQAEQQRNALSEGEEEKREAIRQLCFSLDHYKRGYRQLLRFLSNK